MKVQKKFGLNLILALALVAAVLVSNINLVRAEDQAAAEEFEDQASEIEIDPDNQGTLAEEQPETKEEEESEENVEAGADENEEALEVSEENQTPASANPQVSKNIQDNEFYFEITPEILIKEASSEQEDDEKLFESGSEAFGKKRVIKTYNGQIKSESVKKAWESVKFKVFDKDDKEIASDKFQVTNGVPGRLEGAKYIGPFDKKEKYTIKIDTDTLPKDYHAWFTSESAYDTESTDKGDLLKVEDPKKAQDSKEPGLVATYEPQDKAKPFAEVRFHMDITHVVFARSQKIAEGFFKFDSDGKFTGVNPEYKEDRDYILATVGKDNRLPEVPTVEALKKITPEGRKVQAPHSILYIKQSQKRENGPGFYDYATIRNNDYFGLLNQLVKEWENKPENFEQTGSFLTFVNAQAAKVTFNWNYSGAGDPVVQRVYLNKSLKTNTVTEDYQKYPKTFPKLPKDINMAFVSWNTKADGTGQEFTLDTVVTDDITVYAQWADSVKITFDANGGSGKMDEVTHKVADNPYVLPKCGFKAPKDKVFAGWEIDGKTYKEGKKIKLVKDTVIKALWKEEKTLPKTSTAR